MSKEAIEFLCEINPSFKNMDINNTNTFGGEFLLYCIDKALNQGQSLPIDSVIECLQQVNATLERHGKVEANTDLHNKIINTL